MNLKEIEEEFGFLREMSSPTREGQAIVSLMSIVKELEISAEVDKDLVEAVDSLSEENTKLRERNKELEDAIAVIKKANLRSIAALEGK